MTAVLAADLLHASVAKAVSLLVNHIEAPAAEEVPIWDAGGRVLAADVKSPISVPPFRRSAMDGYAVRWSAVSGASPEAPVRLDIIGEVRSGDRSEQTFQGEESYGAVRIFTGAPVPDGYDCIIIQEMAPVSKSVRGKPCIRVDRPPARGQHIAERGEDIPEGLTVLYRGTAIRAKEIAILASLGVHAIPVYRKPVIAVIPIGDELILPGEPLARGGIYDANGFMVGARLLELGAVPLQRSPVPDSLLAIQAEMRRALAEADAVITIGGVSVGDYDYVRRAAEETGAKPLFTKVLMRPGTPTSAYAADGKVMICLSGNPSACFTGLELLVRSAVLKASGRTEYGAEWLDGRLSDAVMKPCPYSRFARAFAYRDNREWVVEPLHHDKSGNVAAFARANALVCIPAGGGGAASGQEVRFLTIGKS
ncbi:gephyrin-like molybdotransferase Glp [Paenibacillus sp. PL2-23]|uniref:molybdopterin molybdotransferase MoeA n=1 Tax=Paenibacillus sp. PL2-23 TaxID=2100729 RepID=UPI0030F96A86